MTELGSRKRNWNRSFSRFTRRKPTAWAWVSRSAARLSRTTEASSSRSPTWAQELHFVSLSPKRRARRGKISHKGTKTQSKDASQKSPQKGTANGREQQTNPPPQSLRRDRPQMNADLRR